MATLQDVIPFIAVLTVAAVLVGTFFLVGEELKEDYYTEPSLIKTVAYADQAFNETNNLTVVPGIYKDQFLCWNASAGASTPIATVKNPVNSLHAEGASILNISTYAGADLVNCTVNATDFSSERYQGINDSTVSVGTFTDWFDVMVVVFAAAIILGLVFTALVMRRV